MYNVGTAEERLQISTERVFSSFAPHILAFFYYLHSYGCSADKVKSIALSCIAQAQERNKKGCRFALAIYPLSLPLPLPLSLSLFTFNTTMADASISSQQPFAAVWLKCKYTVEDSEQSLAQVRTLSP